MFARTLARRLPRRRYRDFQRWFFPSGSETHFFGLVEANQLPEDFRHAVAGIKMEAIRES